MEEYTDEEKSMSQTEKNTDQIISQEGCCCTHKIKERTQQEYKSLIHRLNRIEGQVRESVKW